MLELRPNCECCDRELPGDSDAAFICSYECTFCRDCAAGHLQLKCPNCSGELVSRPRRAIEKQLESPQTSAQQACPNSEQLRGDH
ncbi:DUF1272 domain-containing protein [Pseudomonas sp. M30-35]|uniref:DUF1272 domain-containing protein n=1 Tax=Pseudomonas sp. M30-35 TaxID=1981174 RepID=UPI000B3CFE0A|nr:DUF1272 domain-containing protein [Pseudomonas sp. M30-35]ARU88379.1 hypothetical protein B9K09_10570 [Pseudomonas sp. M30-35]